MQEKLANDFFILFVYFEIFLIMSKFFDKVINWLYLVFNFENFDKKGFFEIPTILDSKTWVG